EVERETVEVLENEELSLAVVRAGAGRPDGACRGRHRERTVVSLPVVVTGEAEEPRERQDQDRRRDERNAEALRLEARRRGRREIRPDRVEAALEGAARRVNNEACENDEGDERARPPVVLAERLAKAVDHR